MPTVDAHGNIVKTAEETALLDIISNKTPAEIADWFVGAFSGLSEQQQNRLRLLVRAVVYVLRKQLSA